jgi:hypothetical protein
MCLVATDLMMACAAGGIAVAALQARSRPFDVPPRLTRLQIVKGDPARFVTSPSGDQVPQTPVIAFGM